MDINNKTIVFVCQYAAPYEGNFILSLKALESKLMEQFQAKAIYVFPNNAKTQVWMMSFLKAHKVHFISSEPYESINELVRIFEDEHADLCHTHFDGYDIPVVKAAKIFQRKRGCLIQIVWHLHNELWYQKNILKKFYQLYCFWRHYFYYAQNVSMIAVSSVVLRFVHKYKHLYRHEVVIPNGIDVIRLQIGSKHSNKVSSGLFTFLAFGGRNITKRIDLLLEAGILLNKKRRGHFKIILTEGTDTRDIVSLFFKGKNPEWLKLVKQRDNIVELFEESSCFVSTSTAETFSYAIAEASIWGLPVIQSDIEGTLWNAGNPSSYLFKSLDVGDLVSKMEYVMDLDSVKLKEACAISQQNNLKSYTLDAWSDKIIQFYQTIN